MKTITEESDAIVKQKAVLGLREGIVGVDRHDGMPSVNRERRTTFFVRESRVYGRAADKEMIMKFLLSDDVATAPKFQVMPILGMGGVGKTTLAQIIYNDEEVIFFFFKSVGGRASLIGFIRKQ